MKSSCITAIVSALEAAHNGSAAWIHAFNTGNAAGCAAMYEADAVMTAKPFGTFTGREAIEGFWSKLIADGFSDVEYVDPQFEQISDTEVIVSSGWKMNKAHGIITKELWVVQEDGSARLRIDEFEVQG